MQGLFLIDIGLGWVAQDSSMVFHYSSIMWCPQVWLPIWKVTSHGSGSPVVLRKNHSPTQEKLGHVVPRLLIYT